MDAEVFINGKSLGTHHYGYSSFIHDITNQIKTGQNTIAVSVDNASVYGDGALNDYNVYLSNHAAYTSYSDLYTEVIDSDRYYSWTITETDKF